MHLGLAVSRPSLLWNRWEAGDSDSAELYDRVARKEGENAYAQAVDEAEEGG
jgi:hypothetical protein